MSNTLYVDRMPSTISASEVKELFEGVGQVVGCDVVVDGSKSKGFIEMSTEGEARMAVEQLDGTELDGKRIHVFQVV